LNHPVNPVYDEEYEGEIDDDHIP